MTSRPVFVPSDSSSLLVRELIISFEWYPGFSATQKKRNVVSLHAAAARQGVERILEVSTKSEEPLGQALSAFNFEVPFSANRVAHLEAVYQASKVFEHGGPFVELVTCGPLEAKRASVLKSSGRLVAFELGGKRFPLEPKRAFYDWLYVRALSRNPSIVERLSLFDGFSDIEFNPQKSINSQAHACAAVVSLSRRGWLEKAAKSFAGFATTLSRSSTVQPAIFE